MKVTDQLKNLPAKMKKQMRTALLFACATATFMVPIFGGGYSVLKEKPLTSSAAAIEDVDLLLVGASAFGEARKVVNASDNEAIDTFVSNTSTIVGNKWQNIGLIVGAREALSGSTWSTYQSPITLSATEVATYGDDNIADAYNKYKAFGYAVQNLNNSAQKSNTTAVSVDEGLDAMSTAAIKLGSFGVKFLNDYNPGPVLLALYDSRNLATYSQNKLVQIVTNNEVLQNVICLFGDKVPGTGVSFFVLLNGVIAIIGFALSMLLTLLGNRTIGDNIKHLLVRIVVGTIGIYLISNLMSVLLKYTTETILNVTVSETSHYVENNLNVYDWYLTGFSLPSGTTLKIDDSGNFVFTRADVRAINQYTYNRLVGGANDNNMKARMETYAQNGNMGTASFVTPSQTTGGEGSAWSTDAYYAIMDNYAQNKDDLLDGKDEEGSPLADKSSVRYASQYFWMSYLNMRASGDGWEVTGIGGSSFYGLNPISAFNLIRSDFSGETITSTATVYPPIAYVAFDAVSVHDATGSTNMNSITRFIASFTLILAAMKGLITIFTAGFGGILAGGVKTSFGSSHGLGQALGGVIAIFGGVIGISVIMSMSLSLLDTIYGISKDLLVGTEVVDAFLQPLRDSLGKIPVFGSLLMIIASNGVDLVLTLILSLTFPKLGGIPITVFAQFMADIPGRIAERAMMIESMLMSGRSSAGGGLGHGRAGSGQYGRAAQGMASQAFTSGTKQAGAVMAAGTAAVGALAGASLSMAGKAINKKADSVEGKPKNPGLKNWDELTPEQQTKAAAVAESTDDWKNMDEEARQNACQEAGVYDDNTADIGSGTTDTEQTVDNEQTSDTEQTSNTEQSVDSEEVEEASSAGEPSDGSAGGTEQTIEDTHVPGTAGMEDSISAARGETADSTADSVTGKLPDAEGSTAGGNSPMTGGTSDQHISSSIGQAESGTTGKSPDAASTTGSGEPAHDGQAQGDVHSPYINGTTGQTNSAGPSGKVSEGASISGGTTENGVTNVEGDHVENGDQQFHTNVEQQNKMDAKNVDESRHLNADEGTGSDISGMADQRTADASGILNAPGTSSGSDMKDMPGAQGLGMASVEKDGQTGPGSGRFGTQTLSGAGGRSNGVNTSQSGTPTYHSVNDNISQTDGNTNLNVAAEMTNRNQFNAGDNSHTVNTPETDLSQSEGLDQNNMRQQAERAADNRATGQSMNGTSTSAWGREMSIKDQKTARRLHAVGDALQMVGGNRTMGQGISDALGHAKDAALAYTLPEEMGYASTFMTSVRVKRLEQQQRRNNKNGKQ